MIIKCLLPRPTTSRSKLLSTKQYAMLLALATGAGSLPTMGYAQSTWTGGYSGSSGVDWHYSIQEDGGRVQVSAFGWLNGERLPITCQEAILDAVRAFETTCTHSRQGAPGIPAYTRFVLQGRLAGNAATITYAAANRGKASILVRRQETTAKGTAQVPMSPPLRATPPPLPQLTDEQRAFASLPKETVAAIQTALKQLGHYSGSIDGAAGPQTSEAIKKWQRRAGAPITGVLTDPQQATLQAQASARGSMPPSLVPPAPAPTLPKFAEPPSPNPQIARIPDHMSPAAPQPAESPRPPVQQAAPTIPAGRSFGDCSQVESLFTFSAASAFNEDPNSSILGVPTREWTTEVLEHALNWGRKCIEKEKAKNIAARMQGELRQFEIDVRGGLVRGREQRENLRRYAEAMDSVTPLPNGGSITCRALTTDTGRPGTLDDDFFGRPFGAMSARDFEVLMAKAAACKTAFASIRVSVDALSYQAPSGLEGLSDFQARLLQEAAEKQKRQQLQRDLENPTKRAQLLAASEEAKLKRDEDEIHASLVGKPLKQPTTSASDVVIYCSGYFSSERAQNALVRADLLPSAEAAQWEAIGIRSYGSRWLQNREQVLGAAHVLAELLPIQDMGKKDGLAATPASAAKFYRACNEAIEKLNSELKRRR